MLSSLFLLTLVVGGSSADYLRTTHAAISLPKFPSEVDDICHLLEDFFGDKLPEHVDQFCDFVIDYDKKYESSDAIFSAFSTFSDNMYKIDAHDSDYHGFSLGINEYMDLTPEEFRASKTQGSGGCLLDTHMSLNESLTSTSRRTTTSGCDAFTPSSNVLPESVDWRAHDSVTPVKNQGQCGSCWSFSATGAMEGAWAVHSGDLVSIAEQQLVDCSTDYGNNGCNGGLMDLAFDYAIDHGMCAEADVPYSAKDGGACPLCDTVVTISKCVDVTPNNQLHLKEAVSIGPVSIAIEADARVFQLYRKGIISSTGCGTNLDHGVLIVGYGSEDGSDYWIVKNSWGDGWGEDGYLRIARNDLTDDKGICGIAMQPSYPVV